MWLGQAALRLPGNSVQEVSNGHDLGRRWPSAMLPRLYPLRSSLVMRQMPKSPTVSSVSTG